MALRAVPDTAKVTPIRPRRRRPSGRSEAARYLAEMTLELERLANTADLELVSYFLSLARIEAENHVESGDEAAPSSKEDQAPYRAD